MSKLMSTEDGDRAKLQLESVRLRILGLNIGQMQIFVNQTQSTVNLVLVKNLSLRS